MTPDVRTLFSRTRHAKDIEAFATAYADLCLLADEWSSLREAVFNVLKEFPDRRNPRTAYLAANYCRLDQRLAADNVDTVTVDLACDIVLTLTAHGENWFGEPEMEGWIQANYCLDRLTCGAAALPRLVDILGARGSTLRHAYTVTCILAWVDFWIDGAADPLSAEEWRDLCGRGWSLEGLHGLRAAGVASLGNPAFEPGLAAGLERNDRDAAVVRAYRDGGTFSWFDWRDMMRLQGR
ncbi:MAG: hypothetical protein COW30_12930 [Rhodospirillales bacterium CG15_BIG_FIL_POST_REV_8_21_14_020_66_15]|nr:MAG: hypothetical protein COW30_12930 [Rhodospirillales bacterium CG15_BIG_FIL_POST_REV_8_21_14_020_66_15]